MCCSNSAMLKLDGPQTAVPRLRRQTARFQAKGSRCRSRREEYLQATGLPGGVRDRRALYLDGDVGVAAARHSCAHAQTNKAPYPPSPKCKNPLRSRASTKRSRPGRMDRLYCGLPLRTKSYRDSRLAASEIPGSQLQRSQAHSFKDPRLTTATCKGIPHSGVPTSRPTPAAPTPKTPDLGGARRGRARAGLRGGQQCRALLCAHADPNLKSETYPRRNPKTL